MAAASTAFSIGASGNTMFADLPPSSRVTGITLSPAACAIRRPTSVEPVKAILSTPGCSTKACPQTLPGPGVTFTTPGGYRSAVSSANFKAVIGVLEAGFNTTQLPAARAGASFQPEIRKGKFHGTISPATP